MTLIAWDIGMKKIKDQKNEIEQLIILTFFNLLLA